MRDFIDVNAAAHRSPNGCRLTSWRKMARAGNELKEKLSASTWHEHHLPSSTSEIAGT